MGRLLSIWLLTLIATPLNIFQSPHTDAEFSEPRTSRALGGAAAAAAAPGGTRRCSVGHRTHGGSAERGGAAAPPGGQRGRSPLLGRCFGFIIPSKPSRSRRPSGNTAVLGRRVLLGSPETPSPGSSPLPPPADTEQALAEEQGAKC